MEMWGGIVTVGVIDADINGLNGRDIVCYHKYSATHYCTTYCNDYCMVHWIETTMPHVIINIIPHTLNMLHQIIGMWYRPHRQLWIY